MPGTPFEPRPPHPTRRSAAVLPVLLCLALAALTGCTSDPAQVSSSTDGAAASGGSSADSPHASSKPSAGTTPSKRPAAPTRVSISSIGVSSSLLRLGLNADGTVEVPPADKGMTAGWYTGSTTPGERGAAVIIGHNDTRFGKAVFHDLKKIDKGADIAVRDALGKTTHFTVTGTESVSKKAFPTDKVYGKTPDATLRLITCDGSFDAQGHPVNNLIVYAMLR
ncbi:class F sortase [Streptomyces sp. NPDC051320]|uniref:class F sortase n=1 Tax=Streptomyces sp. NPDC051320 TaxID=3154644 RepID=UPI00343E8F0B